MPRVIHIDASDEIADVVGRIRGAADGEETEVALAVPEGGRALNSPMDLRLIRQAGTQRNLRVAVVSADGRLQGLARDAGLPTYASVPAYERGIELERPRDEGSRATAAAILAARTGVAPPSWDATRPSTAARGSAAAQPPPGARLGNLAATGGDRRRPYYYGAAALGAVGLLLLLLVLPTARVTMTLDAQPLSVSPTLQGSTDATLATSPDHVVTTLVAADGGAGFTATPTGTKTLPPVAATGIVVIKSDLPFPSAFDIPKGEEFDTSDNPPVKFAATQDTKVCAPGTGDAPCPPGSGSTSIPVSDAAQEAKGNVPAGAINKWPQNPCDPKNFPTPVAGQPAPPAPQCAASDLTVSNPAPTSGGADPKKLIVASAQDVQNFQNQVAATEKQLTDSLTAQMQKEAGKRQFAVDSSHAGLTINFTVAPALPRADQEYQATPIAVTGRGKAATYDPEEVRRVVRADLQQLVPRDQILAQNPAIPPPIITQSSSDDGTVILSANGTGFAQPKVNLLALKTQFTGKSRAEVQRLARRTVGAQVQDVDISQSPLPLPWLPFFSGRIEVRQNVIAKPAAP